MSSEKRLVLTLLLTVASVYGIQIVMERTGLIPPPPPPKPPILAKDEPGKVKGKALDVAKGAEAEKPGKPQDELPDRPLQTQCGRGGEAGRQAGARSRPRLRSWSSVRTMTNPPRRTSSGSSSTRRARRSRWQPRHAMTPRSTRRTRTSPAASPGSSLIEQGLDSKAPGSLALTVTSANKPLRPANVDPDAEDAVGAVPKIESWLDSVAWEVVREKDGAPAVRTFTKPHPVTKVSTECQELAFRITVSRPGRHGHQGLSALEGGRWLRRRPEVLIAREGLEVHLQAVRAARHPDRGGVVHLDLPRCLLRPGQGELDRHHDLVLHRRRKVSRATLPIGSRPSH